MTNTKYDPVDWDELWTQTPTDDDWLCEPILPRGRSVVTYSPPKARKSLLALDVAARLATGARVLDRQQGTPVDVVYIDLEMSDADLVDRLDAMGYGPATDLTHLHYYLLPDLPRLDTVEGGKDLRRLATTHDADLVIIDTLTVAIGGDENDAKTLTNYHAHTGSVLKRDGRTVWRLDHSGKDLERGQRGTSQKAGDPDVVWQLMVRDEASARLRATHRRVTWVPEIVDLILLTDPLRFEHAAKSYPDGTTETAVELDRLNVPHDTSTRAAGKILRASGWRGRDEIVVAAVRLRRDSQNRESLSRDPRIARESGPHPTGGAVSREAPGNGHRDVDELDLLPDELWPQDGGRW